MNWLDLLDAANLIDRIHGLLLTAKHGGSHAFRIDRSKWTGAEVERLLKRYKIPVFGRRVTTNHAIFLVSHKQAAWAEYVMLRAGIVPDGPLVNPKNAGWAARHAPGQPPPAWADRPRPARRKR